MVPKKIATIFGMRSTWNRILVTAKIEIFTKVFSGALGDDKTKVRQLKLRLA